MCFFQINLQFKNIPKFKQIYFDTKCLRGITAKRMDLTTNDFNHYTKFFCQKFIFIICRNFVGFSVTRKWYQVMDTIPPSNRCNFNLTHSEVITILEAGFLLLSVSGRTAFPSIVFVLICGLWLEFRFASSGAVLI